MLRSVVNRSVGRVGMLIGPARLFGTARGGARAGSGFHNSDITTAVRPVVSEYCNLYSSCGG